MSIREKVRKVFRRQKPIENASGIKIVYYRRHELPPSKFKGPFDRAHQKKLAAWSFEAAQADRPRSPDLSLSPCTTVPDYLNAQAQVRQVADAVQDQARPRLPRMHSSSEASPHAYHDEFIQDRQGTASLSSDTAVDPESFSDSTMTLFLDPLDDDAVKKIKEPGSARKDRTAAPMIRSAPTSPLPMKGMMPKPFAPEDLTRALNAVQICT